MNFNKTLYIENELFNDYILKAAMTGKAQLVIAFLMCFMHKSEIKFFTPIMISLLVIILILIFRLIIIKKYFSNSSLLYKTVHTTDKTSLVISFLWGSVGIFTTLSYSSLDINIFLTFLLLIAYSLGSINSLCHRGQIHFVYNLFVLAPLVFFALMEYSLGENKGAIWLIVYVIMAIVYSVKQSRDINREHTNRFSYQFDLKKSLEEITLSKKQLEEESMKTFHASRLSSLGELAGGVAHEINNPLTIIQNLSRMILQSENEKLSEGVKVKLNKIISASDRMAKIVKGMKIVASKNDDIEHSIVKVSQLLDVSLTLYEEGLKNLSIYFSVSNDEDLEVACNPLQVSQILINLIGNAKDALEMISDKSIEKSIKVIVTRVTFDNDNQVEIKIINSGPLIPQVVVDKIFDPFYSTKPMGKGTGLGLSISKSLAKNNHGELVYEPFEGQVCFKLSLLSKKPV